MASFPRLAPLNKSNRFDLPSPTSQGISSPGLGRSRADVEFEDPLLADLSPAAVLQVLRDNETNLPVAGSKERLLVDSIGEASQHERALGIRAALAGKRLKDYIVEIQSWKWPHNGFEPSRAIADQAYWGSLPSSDVLEKQNRLERIKDELDLLELEELKTHVRNVHLQPESRRISSSSQISSGSISYTRLADFNVLITAMIVQALPDLAILSRMMDDWSIRLFVLSQVPSFLQQMEDTKVALQSAWAAIGKAVDASEGLSLSRSSYEQIKKVLEDRVADLAKRIDSMLDALEGHDDGIPDQWIDDMEEAERDYKDWVVEAGRLVSLYESQTAHAASQEVLQASSQVASVNDNATLPTVSPMLVDSKESDAETVRVVPDLNGTIKEENATASAKPTSHLQSPTKKPLFFMQGTEGVHRGNPVNGSVVEQAHPQTQDPPLREVSRKPLPLVLDTSQAVTMERSGSHMSTHTSATSSSGFTDMSSPQIFDASEIQFYRSPMDESFPITITRDAEDAEYLKSTGYNATNRFRHGRSVSAIEPMTRSRTSSMLSQLTINANDQEVTHRQEPIEEKLANEPPQSPEKEDEDQFYDALSSPRKADSFSPITVPKTRPSGQNSTSSSTFILEKATTDHKSRQVEDKMTDKITHLLTKIPAPIQLASHPPGSDLGLDAKHSSPSRHQRSTTPAALTLSPASTKPRAALTSDSGVRVYHLHQPGREIPIKLFIRLVGSEERVMVRVGGGWADLAEYLKEYALHHGRRSASSGNFELKGLPTAQNAATSIFDTNFSPSTPSPTATPNSKQDTYTSRREISEPPRTPESGDRTDLPGSMESERFRSSSFSATTPEDGASSVGLAGPKIRKIELSPKKKAWVDGMLHQARHISSEHKKVEDIGDLGKIGNTKRVFLKGKTDGDAL